MNIWTEHRCWTKDEVHLEQLYKIRGNWKSPEKRASIILWKRTNILANAKLMGLSFILWVFRTSIHNIPSSAFYNSWEKSIRKDFHLVISLSEIFWPQGQNKGSRKIHWSQRNVKPKTGWILIRKTRGIRWMIHARKGDKVEGWRMYRAGRCDKTNKGEDISLNISWKDSRHWGTFL